MLFKSIHKYSIFSILYFSAYCCTQHVIFFIIKCYLFPIKLKYYLYIAALVFCVRNIVIDDQTLHIELVVRKEMNYNYNYKHCSLLYGYVFNNSRYNTVTTRGGSRIMEALRQTTWWGPLCRSA